MDEHAFPPTGFAVAWLGCTLHLLYSGQAIAYGAFMFSYAFSMFILIQPESHVMAYNRGNKHDFPKNQERSPRFSTAIIA